MISSFIIILDARRDQKFLQLEVHSFRQRLWRKGHVVSLAIRDSRRPAYKLRMEMAKVIEAKQAPKKSWEAVPDVSSYIVSPNP